MTEVSVIAERSGTVNNIAIQLGMNFFDAKFDTGSSISITAFDFDTYASDQIDSLDSDELLELIDEFIPE